MKILVTGAYGLIGQHLINSIPENNQVIATSRIKRKNFDNKKNIINKIINWESEIEINKLLKGVDIVIHGAAVDQSLSFKNPLQAIEFNSLYTQRLINLAIKKGVKKFIYFSTVHVYKSRLIGNISENTGLSNSHPYSISKKLGEEFIINAVENTNTTAIILRLSNVIAPPLLLESNGWGLVSNDFCKQAISNREIKIKNDVSILRDYVDIIQITDLVNHLINYKGKFKKTIYNVSSGNSKTLLEVAQTIQKKCQKFYDFKPIIKYNPSSNLDKTHLKINSKNLKDIGFNIDSNFENSIENNLKFIFKNHRKFFVRKKTYFKNLVYSSVGKKNHILITGSTGFIGQHLLEEIISPKNDITVLVQNINKVKKFPWSNKVHFIEGNLMSDILKKFNPENSTIIHLAWGQLNNYNSDLHLNKYLPESIKFLKKMLLNGCKKILVTGTCFEYGMKNGPLDVNTKTDPINNYALAKDKLRQKLSELKLEYDFKFFWIRIFYTYGKGQNERSVLAQLDKAIDENKEVFEMTEGEQLRDYLPVKEVSKQIINTLKFKDEGIFNICSQKPISIRRLVENRIQNRNSNIKMILGYYDYPEYEPMAFWGVK